MSPRRKQAESEEETTPVEGAETPAAKPKKRKTTHKKAPAKKKAEDVSPAPQAPAAPTAPAPEKKLDGVNIPIKPATPAPLPATISIPERIKIEPEAMPASEKEDETELWHPPRPDDADLTMPPRVLLQRKQIPKPEVEDILEEPEDETEHEADRTDLRPRVKTGLFRKIAVVFACLAVIVGVLVSYVVFAHATVIIHPQKADIKTEQELTVAADAKEGDVTGEVLEITVAGERTEAPSDSVTTDGVAGGTVTLINESSEDQTLVATTRLLTPEGVLFRLKSRVNVPAKGQIAADVYADQPGAGGDIGPSTFTIPGLSASLQKVIYAKSDAAMTGGTVSRGVLSAEDVTRVEQALREELVAQAKDELAKQVKGEWSGQQYLVETMNRFVNGKIGEAADGVTVRLTLRVREVAFDLAKAQAVATEDLTRGLTADRELIGVDSDNASIEVFEADPKAGTAVLHLKLSGKSRVSLDSPQLDPSKLRGLSLDGVKAYFEGIEGVDGVDVIFRPFWPKRMPDLADHIEFQIEK